MVAKKKKAASKKAAAKGPARVEAPAQAASVARPAPEQIAMLLNGQSVGMVAPGSKSIGEVAKEIAVNNGLKSYAILIDGVKVLAQDAAKPILGATTIEVFAKETRGSLL